MSSYSPSEPSFQPGPTFSAYPDPPSSTSPRAPVAQVVPHGYGYPSNQDPSLQQTPPQQDAVSKPNGQQHSRSANRLRKACDNCSIRKVKVRVGEVLPSFVRLIIFSVTKEDLHVKPVRALTYPARSTDQPRGGGPRTNWPNISRGRKQGSMKIRCNSPDHRTLSRLNRSRHFANRMTYQGLSHTAFQRLNHLVS